MSLGWTVAVLAAVGWGAATAWWTPRGPLTPAQALWSVVISLAVGVLAGVLGRSRWTILLAPAAFVAALELARWHVDGPSVDRVHLSAFGVIAMVTGRGLHGLLSVLPMAVGAAYGAGVARYLRRTGGRGPVAPAAGQPGPDPATAGERRLGPRVARYAGRATAGLLAAVVVAVTVAAAIPARTAPIRGPDGKPLRGSIAELTSVDAGGHRLGMMIRGRSATAPVLLFLPGAPGGSEIGSMRRHLSGLEQHFVVVTLDRRGGGKSYPALDPTATVSLDGAVDDTIAVSLHLRQRFGREKIYLLAHSGGSIVGTLAVQRHPELYRAYIGTGQAVHLPTSDRIFYHDILAWARRDGNDALVKKLTDLGPPPYRGFYPYEAIVANENSAYDYDRGRSHESELGAFGNLDVPEYTLLEKAHSIIAFMDTWEALYPDMQVVDLRSSVRRLDVPTYFVQGRHEMRGLAEPFAQWYAILRAPAKHLTTLDASGHRAIFEQPSEFTAVLRRVLAETGEAIHN